MPHCPKCSKYFERQWSLDRHLDKKIPCNKNKCPDCNVFFANHYTLRAHREKSVCLKKQNQETNVSDPSAVKTSINLALQLEIAKEATKKAAIEAEAEVRKAEIELETKKLEYERTSAGKQVNINTTINGNNNKVINLVTFGNENLSGLSTGVMNRISTDPVAMIPDIALRKIYFNPKIPENQIIQAIDYSSKEVKYFEGDSWKVANRDEFSRQLVGLTSNAIIKRCTEMPHNPEVYNRLKFKMSNEIDEMGFCNAENMYDFHKDLQKDKEVTFTTK